MTEIETSYQSSSSSPGIFDLHKDRLPSRTVELIQERLNWVGFRKENVYLSWKQPYRNCCSCFLIFRDYPFFIANGKGIRKEYALASAYAEFIERLQCRGGFHFARLGLMKNTEEAPLPRRVRGRDELYNRHQPLFENMDSRLYPLLPEELPTLPAGDIFDQSVADLPISLMYTASGSTGMCAGNNFEEACSQGLCEIMERHALHRFYSGGVEGFPTIDLRKVRLRSPFLQYLLGEIIDSGCDVTVKDCTLGGRFPVLGVILRDSVTGNVAVALGADPLFDIALQRCLTEALQGRNRPELGPGRGGATADKPDSVYNAPHLMTERLLSDTGEARFEDAFLSRPSNNRHYLRFLFNRLRPGGGSAYIRDFSILGFPGYYIYVEKMSPINPDLLLDVKLVGEIDDILDVIFNLSTTSRDRLKDCADLLFNYVDRYASSFLLKLAKLFGRVPVFSWLDPRWLLAFMLVEAKEYGKAAAVLDQALPGYTGEALAPEPPAADVFSRYCRLKAARDRDILRRLREEFGGSVSADRLKNLLNENYAGFVNQDAKGRKFAGLPIPRCTDRNACRRCPCRNGCFRGKWRELRASWKERAREMDQSGILEKSSGLI